PRRVLGIHTEDDGLLESVSAFLEELADLVGHAPGALVDHQGAVEILLVVNPVLDLLAVLVHFSRGGAVSLGVAVRPICVADLKYSRISRQAESSAALPRWHSSITIRSKKLGESSRKIF